jgi:hypothetical protein
MLSARQMEITTSFIPMLTRVTRMSRQKSDDSRHYSEAVGTRLTPQTKRQFNQYRDENELSNSQALRRLIRDSLNESRPQLRAATLTIGLAYAAAYLVAGPSGGSAVGGSAIIAGILYAHAPEVKRLYRQRET